MSMSITNTQENSKEKYSFRTSSCSPTLILTQLDPA